VPRLVFRITLFLSSFSPLFALMAFENRGHCLAVVLLGGAVFVGVSGLVAVMATLNSEVGPPIIPLSAVPKDGDVLAYIAVYLVPFLSVDLNHANGIVAFCGFLVVLGIVYINSNMLFVNPLLSIAGYHTFEVTDKQTNMFTLVARQRDISLGVTIRPAQIDRHLRVDARWRPSETNDAD
jgi:hypothetical protein